MGAPDEGGQIGVPGGTAHDEQRRGVGPAEQLDEADEAITVEGARVSPPFTDAGARGGRRRRNAVAAV